MTDLRICTCLPGDRVGTGRKCAGCTEDDAAPGPVRWQSIAGTATVSDHSRVLHLDGQPFPYRTVGGVRVEHGPEEFTRVVVEILVDGPVTVQP